MQARETRRKVAITLGVVGVVVGLMGAGTFGAFKATTTNTGNQIDSGTVKVDQHAGATTLYNLTNQKPGGSQARCVRVTYSGSLAATLNLYVSSGITNGTQYNLQVERGSGIVTPAADMNCTGFAATSVAYNGDLGSFPTTFAGGVTGKAGGGPWSQSDVVDYRFTISQNDDTTANAHTTVTSSGAHTFTWEADSN